MDGVIPKRNSGGDAASTPKAELSLLSSLPPPPAPVLPQQKKPQQPTQSQQQRPQPSRAGSEKISLPQVSLVNNNNTYQPQPKMAALTDRENQMINKLGELASIVSTNVPDTNNNDILSINPKEFMQRENKQSGTIDLFGSFITTPDNQYDFFDTDPVTNTINVTPLPNSRIPIFPEDFRGSKSQHSLEWWGIHQPTEQLLQLHDEKALSLGYPVSNRKGESPSNKRQSKVDKVRGRDSRDSKSSSRKESDSRRRKRSGDSSSRERSRKRNSDDRRHRRS